MRVITSVQLLQELKCRAGRQECCGGIQSEEAKGFSSVSTSTAGTQPEHHGPPRDGLMEQPSQVYKGGVRERSGRENSLEQMRAALV